MKDEKEKKNYPYLGFVFFLAEFENNRSNVLLL